MITLTVYGVKLTASLYALALYAALAAVLCRDEQRAHRDILAFDPHAPTSQRIARPTSNSSRRCGT